MKVKDLKAYLTNVDDNIDVYVFGKKVDTYGIYNVLINGSIVTQIKLNSFKRRNSILQKLKFWK